MLLLSMGALVALALGSACGADDAGVTGPTVSCYEIKDSGSGPTCLFGSSNELEASCTADGSSAGLCPVAGLVGCCLETLSTSSNVEAPITATNGTCYYSPSAAEGPMSACTGFTSGGYPLMWSKTP